MAKGERAAACRHVHTLFQGGAAGWLTDGQLLERFSTQRGEDADSAFALLVERHGPMVLRVCRAVLRDHHDAHDAFQATFLVMLRRGGSLWVRDSLGPWLYQVARRTASYARTEKARRRRFEHRVAERGIPASVEIGGDDLGDVIHEEIGRLPEHYRAAVVLCLLEGLTVEQAAGRLGCPVGTVQSRLARGRERLRRRLIRRGLAPSAGLLGAGLLPWRTASAAVPLALVEETVRAASRIASTRPATAAEVSTTAVTLTEGVLRMMLLSKLKAGFVAALAAGLLAASTAFLAPRSIGASFDDRNGSAPEPQPTEASRPNENPQRSRPTEAPTPSSTTKSETAVPPAPSKPKPWETTVRIKVYGENSVGFGAGTVISSTPQDTIILTCAHIFKLNKVLKQVVPAEYRHKIMVDLFGGAILNPGRHIQVRDAIESHEGVAVDFDFPNDLALVRIRPGRQLQASPIVPPHWKPSSGMSELIAVGCSDGRLATAWVAAMTDWAMQGRICQSDYASMECIDVSAQESSGGGLFTPDGYLAGVCQYAKPRSNRELYARPRAIHRLLDANGLSALYRSGGHAPEPAKTLEIDANSRAPARTDLAKTDPHQAGRDLSGPGALRDIERRLDGVEQKLDRILKALTGSKNVDVR